LTAPDRRQVLSTMQRAGGNFAVQRFLASPGGVVQRQSGAEPMLRMGSRSPAVTTLQQQLVAAGGSLSVDGIFGPGTQKAVIAFQSGAGLTPDGIVGPKTWQALKSGAATTAPAPGGKSKGTPPQILVKLETLKGTLQGLCAGGTCAAAPAPPAPRQMQPILRMGWLDDAAEWAGDKVDSATDWAGEKVDEATDWAGEKVDSATDWAEEKAGEAADWAQESASEAADWAGEQVSDAKDWVEEQVSDAGDWVAEQAGDAADWVQEQAESGVQWVEDKVDAAVEAASETIKEIGDGLRERFPEEMGILDKIISDLGGGLPNWGDLEKRIDDLLNDVTAASGIALNEGETCAVGSTTINTKTNTIKVNGGTVQDAIEAANQMQGGHVASVEPKFDPYEFCPPESEKKPVKAATVKITEIKTMPDWRQKNDFPAAKKMWDDYIAAVNAHEDKHLAIDAKHFTDMNKKAEKTPAISVAAATAELEKVKTAADKENLELDNKEGCIKLNGGTGAVTTHPRNQC
jgi:predicted secreted Zn-dependent protease